MRMSHIVICVVSGATFFYHFFINDKIFGKKSLNIEFVF